MNRFKWTVSLMTPVALLPLLASGQDPVPGTLTMALGDVTAIKQKAEAGDAAAQVALGNCLASTFRASEALAWYKKAAAQGNVEGRYHVGDMLLFGAPGIPKSFGVLPNPVEGIRWTFMAATNLHTGACRNMSKALQRGIGTSTNLVAAYAWLSLYANTPPGSIVGRVELNHLTLRLDANALRQAQSLAAQFKAGHWQLPPIRAVPESDSRLRLSSITLGAGSRLAMINGKTVSEGESTTIATKPAILKVKCLSIRQDSVLIAIEGEDSPRLLHLK